MKRKNHKILVPQSLFVTACALVVVTLSLNLSACPSCKDAYVPGSAEASIGESYSYSVLFFLGMFFSLLAGGTTFIWWKIKRATLAKARALSIANQ